MHISKEIDYGLRAMIVIATSNGDLLTSRQIAEKFRIPYNFLSLILPKLVRAGLVVSTQGPKGGYRLARPMQEVNFLQIIEAIDGPVNLVNCNTKGKCDLDAFCGMVSVWNQLKTNIEKFFTQVTLDRFTDQQFLQEARGKSCA